MSGNSTGSISGLSAYMVNYDASQSGALSVSAVSHSWTGTSSRSGGMLAGFSLNVSHTHGLSFNTNSYTSGCHQTHTHSFDTSYNGSSTDTESRPDNYTIRIWKRIS